MPRVQKYGSPQVQKQPNGNGRLQPSGVAETAESFGAGIGQGLARVGGAAFQQALAIREDEILRADQAAVQDAESQTIALATRLEWDDKDGFRKVRGKDAGALPDTVGKSFKDGAAAIEKGLTTERQRLQYARIRDAHSARLTDQVAGYSMQEFRRYDDEGQQALIAVAQQAAVKAASTGDLKGAGFNLERAMENAVLYSDRQKESPAAKALRLSQLQSSTHAAVIDALMASGPQGDMLAHDYLEAHEQEISGNHITAVKTKVGVAGIEGDALRSAQHIWNELGPKGDSDPVSLDKMEDEARAMFADFKEADKLIKATISQLRERKTAFDVSAADRLAGTKSTVMKALLDGATLDQVVKMPEFLGLPGGDQVTIKEHLVDRGYALEQRATAAKEYLSDQIWEDESRAQTRKGWQRAAESEKRTAESDAHTRKAWAKQDADTAAYAVYEEILSDPAAFIKLKENDILAELPKLGKTLMNDLLTKHKSMTKDKAVQASIDGDLFNKVADDNGFEPYKAKKTKEDLARLGALRKFVEDRIFAEGGDEKVDRTRKQQIMEEALIELIPANEPWFGFNTPGKRAFEIGIEDIPAAERPQIIDALKKAKLPVTEDSILQLYRDTVARKK